MLHHTDGKLRLARAGEARSVAAMSTQALEIAVPAPRRRPLARRAWVALSTAFAAFLGLLPHILHHAGPLAGAALFAGAGGSILFGAIGFVAAVPFLLRIRRHCGNWRVPGAVLAAMAVAFSLSTFVIGPAIAGGGDDGTVEPQRTPVTDKPSGQAAPATDKPSGHEAHH